MQPEMSFYPDTSQKRYRGTEGIRKELVIMRCLGISAIKDRCEDMKREANS